ncbi:MAG: hypothetical protein M0R73_09340 [Dehalococcoidia bacterium]|nr:hypothetical protein [Dehalococcoidia bacterium]
MQSLSSLVNERDRNDPLVQTVAALLDSGLIVATRDGAGRFVQVSEVYGDALGVDSDVRGAPFLTGQRYYDTSGHEIPRSEHPAQVARMSGIPQRNRVLGARASNGRELWFHASYIPLHQQPEGWSVLTVGIPLDQGGAFTPPATSGATDLEPLLAFAESVAGHRLPPSAVALRLGEVIGTLVPRQASCALLWRRGGVLEVEPLGHGRPRTRQVRLTGEAARRWKMPGTCYIPHMRDQDTIGTRLAMEYDPPIRTFALIPAPDTEGERVASLGITHPEVDALQHGQIRALERLARLAGAALAVSP